MGFKTNKGAGERYGKVIRMKVADQPMSALRFIYMAGNFQIMCQMMSTFCSTT